MSDVSCNWFEIPVKDLNRATEFYGALLDRPLGEIDGPDGPMKVFLTAEGPAGTLTQSGKAAGADGVAIYLNCPDIDAALGRCANAGGKVAQEKTSIGPFGHIAAIEDTEGNQIGLHFNAG